MSDPYVSPYVGPSSFGKVKKLGPMHYKVVWPPKRDPKVKMGRGRTSGTRDPVPRNRQLNGVNYCASCNRQLNSNNAGSKCKHCAPHTKGANT